MRFEIQRLLPEMAEDRTLMCSIARLNAATLREPPWRYVGKEVGVKIAATSSSWIKRGWSFAAFDSRGTMLGYLLGCVAPRSQLGKPWNIDEKGLSVLQGDARWPTWDQEPSFSHVLDLAVKPRVRRKGIALALRKAFESYCHDKGVRIGFAVTHPESKALSLLQRHLGWEILGPNGEEGRAARIFLVKVTAQSSP